MYPSNKRITAEMEEQMKRSYIDGSTAEQVAIAFKVSPHTVRTYAHKRWKTAKKTSFLPTLVCVRCTCRLTVKNSRYCHECIKESRRTGTGRLSGPSHPNWKGGHAARLPRFTAEYRMWRKAVFERDDYTCRICGERGGRLNADHIIPQSVLPEARLIIFNGRTLCVACHRKTPSYGSKASTYVIEMCQRFMNARCPLDGYRHLTNGQAYEAKKAAEAHAHPVA